MNGLRKEKQETLGTDWELCWQTDIKPQRFQITTCQLVTSVLLSMCIQGMSIFLLHFCIVHSKILVLPGLCKKHTSQYWSTVYGIACRPASQKLRADLKLEGKTLYGSTYTESLRLERTSADHLIQSPPPLQNRARWSWLFRSTSSHILTVSVDKGLSICSCHWQLSCTGELRITPSTPDVPHQGTEQDGCPQHRGAFPQAAQGAVGLRHKGTPLAYVQFAVYLNPYALFCKAAFQGE